MTGMFRIIMAANGVTEYGACPFSLIENKLHPCKAAERIPAHAKSAIIAIFPYRVEGERGNLSAYAAVQDYHRVVERLLEGSIRALKKTFAGYEFAAFVDNSPVPEVYSAALCGLGVIGDNGLLINRVYGSWCFIGSIITDLEIPYTVTEIQYCRHCGRCREACPGKALGEGGFVRERCLSYITQKKGDLSHEESELIRLSGCAWGCDICQEQCPENANAAFTNIPAFIRGFRPSVHSGEPLELEKRAYGWRGENVIKRNLDILGD